MDLDTVLPFGAASSEVAGQLSILNPRPYATPLPPAAALSLVSARFVAEWAPNVAYRCFLLHLQTFFDEDLAYDALVDSGCPLELAGGAWDRWTAQQRELVQAAGL